MFKSLKSFIHSRLGRGIVIEDLIYDYGYFIKIHHRHLLRVVSFLKNDPDVRLSLLEQVISLPNGIFSWNHIGDNNKADLDILYQFKSLKLPYRVTLVVEINVQTDSIPSIASLFLGTRWQEDDIRETHGLTIEESEHQH